MQENIDLIHESSKEISHGLITLEQIHVPVYRETKANADKIEVVIQEISKVDDDLRREYERLKKQQNELMLRAETLKPNEFWKNIPLISIFLYDKKMTKIHRLNTEAENIDSQKTEKETRMRKINDIFLNVQSYLIPSL